MVRAYKSTVKISLAYIADVLIFIVLVEAIRILAAPFNGWWHPSFTGGIRIAVYGWSLAQMFVIRIIANLPLRLYGPTEEAEKFSRLRLSTLIAFALCELIVLLGFFLFLIEGLRKDFYVLTLLSIFYFIVYFPKKKEWEVWLEQNRGL